MMYSRFFIVAFFIVCGVQSNELENIPDAETLAEILEKRLGKANSDEHFSHLDKVIRDGEDQIPGWDKVVLNEDDQIIQKGSPVPEDLTLPREDDVEESQAPENATSTPKNITHVFINCSRTEDIIPEVELVNSTRLLSLLVVNPNITRAVAADCLGVYFFARWCPFSTMAAPHINALPRAFPNIRMVAVDAMKYHMFNTQYGVVGVPTFILFHNGRPAVKFNETDYNLERFSSFITKFTTVPPIEKISVTSADFSGPVPSSVVKESDYFLWLSWTFLATSAIVFFTKSSLYRKMVEAVKVTWRESEAQHDHMD